MMMMMKYTVKIDKLQLNGNFLNSFKNKQIYLKDIHLNKTYHLKQDIHLNKTVKLKTSNAAKIHSISVLVETEV